MCAVNRINVRHQPDKCAPCAVDRTNVRRTSNLLRFWPVCAFAAVFVAVSACPRLRRHVRCVFGVARSILAGLRLCRRSQRPLRPAASSPSRGRVAACRFSPSFLADAQFCLGAPFPAAVSRAAPANISLEIINILCAGGVSPTRCSIEVVTSIALPGAGRASRFGELPRPRRGTWQSSRTKRPQRT